MAYTVDTGARAIRKNRAAPIAAALVAVVALGGCVAPAPVQPVAYQPAPLPPAPRSVYEEGRWALAGGSNSIVGHAAINGEGDAVRTCAEARLIPAISATRTRMNGLYGANNDIVRIRAANVPPADPDLQRLVKQVRCDRRGNFRFARVPDGDFFVTVGFAGQPFASVKREVSVRGGEVISVQLSD